ncbi:MAG: amidohydrolase family protein [Planctomycetales bacterium]
MERREPVLEPGRSLALRARWIFPVIGPPQELATLHIVDGHMAGISTGVEAQALDLGNMALIPGLVNAHTHLELSDTVSPLAPPQPFTTWLRAVLAHRRGRGHAATASARAIRLGWAECQNQGTTLTGDIVSASWSETDLPESSLSVVAFLEILGLDANRIPDRLLQARQFLEGRGGADQSARVVRGLSPHAPYSVHPDLFDGLVSLAHEADAPLAIHLAETHAELELLERGTGEFVEFLVELGVWNESAIPRGTRPVDYLRRLATLDRALVIHGNYLRDDDVDVLAGSPGVSVVYCPRTHAYFGHAEHPWRKLLARGVNVAVGTDSRASNPDLSVFEELKFLHQRYPDFPPQELLALGTVRGARGLGREESAGSLAPGRPANLAAVALPDGNFSDPHALLFHSESQMLGSVLGDPSIAKPFLSDSLMRLLSPLEAHSADDRT